MERDIIHSQQYLVQKYSQDEFRLTLFLKIFSIFHLLFWLLDMSDREARNLEAVQMYQTIGCSRAKRNHLQVYRYNAMQSSAAQLSARFLFDRSHQPNNVQSEIHSLQFINMKVNVTRQFLDNDDATRNSLDKNWYYLGAIKESKSPLKISIKLFIIIWFIYVYCCQTKWSND